MIRQLPPQLRLYLTKDMGSLSITQKTSLGAIRNPHMVNRLTPVVSVSMTVLIDWIHNELIIYMCNLMRTSLLFSPKATLTFFPLNLVRFFSLVITGNRWNYRPAQPLALLKTWLWAKSLRTTAWEEEKKVSCLRRFYCDDSGFITHSTNIYWTPLLWQLYASEAWSMAVAKQTRFIKNIPASKTTEWEMRRWGLTSEESNAEQPG